MDDVSLLTRRRLLGTGAGLASALGIGVGVPQKVQASGGVTPDDSDSETVGGLYAVATDTDGSSEDSRVALGTLGHHHEWANTAPSELHFDEASAGTQRWRFDPDDRALSPTIVEGTVFVSSGNKVYALDAETIDEQWHFTAEAEIHHEAEIHTAPQVVDGTVYVGSRNHSVYAVDAQTGEKEWRFETGDRVRSSPTVMDGRVFVGSDDNNVYALDTETGEERWHFKTGEEVATSPTVLDGSVFITSSDGYLYALNTETGDEQWRFETDPGQGRVNASTPTAADGVVYVGSGSGSENALYAIDQDSGEELWTFETDTSVSSLPTVADGTVYVISAQQLYAIDQDSGEKQWNIDMFSFSSPTVVDDSVFLGDRDGYVYEFDRATGEEKWRFEIGESVPVNSPTVVDGTLFVGSVHTDPETGPDPNPEVEPSSPSSSPEDQPGFGIVSTLTALGGLGYLLKRRVLNDEKRTQ